MQGRHAAAESQSSQEQQWFGHRWRLVVMLLQQTGSESDESAGEAEPTEQTPAL